MKKLEKNINRIDGRGQFEYRKIQLEAEISKKAEGSAKIKLGDTQVIAGIKISTGEPYPDSPNEGILIVNSELLPLASPEFEPGPPREKAIEIARVVDRGIREAEAIDVEKLCIEPGEKVWMVWIDLYTLDHNGNIIDAAGLAALKALYDTYLPKYEDEEIVREKGKKLPMKSKPIPCTFGKIDGDILLDPILEEENELDCRLTITTDEKGRVCSMQKGGIGTFTKEEVFKLIEIAKEKGKEIREEIFK